MVKIFNLMAVIMLFNKVIVMKENKDAQLK